MPSRPGRPAARPRSAAVRTLLEEVAADPHQLLRLSVSGVSGAGKSALLEDLAGLYAAAGITVVGSAAEVPGEQRAALLLDDAQDLPEGELEATADLLARRDLHVVVAYRPWPQSPALDRLALALQRERPALVLGALSREDVAAFTAAVLGRPAAARVVDLVLSVTGGSPRYVGRFVRALVLQGEDHPERLDGVVQQIADEMAHLDEPLRELLLALAVGLDQAPGALAALGGSEELLTRARSGGFLLADGTVVPVVARALVAVTPRHRVRELRRALLERCIREGGPVLDVARQLARSGAGEPDVVRILVRAADDALGHDPAEAARLYDEAVAAGGDELALAARRAQAAAMTGDLERAGRTVDRLLAVQDPPDARRAADVGAAVWAQRGMLARAAQTYRWLGRDRIGSSAAVAVVPLLGTGDRKGAEVMLHAVGGGPPTVQAVSAALTAEGLLATLDGHPTRALGTLVRASDMMTAGGTLVPLPDQPAALAALVGLHTGEREIAVSVLDAAIAGGQGGAAALRRLLLLRAWAAMVGDEHADARHHLAQARRCQPPPAPRDELLKEALEVGLARRAGDLPRLAWAWRRARQTILHFPVDLYTLLPLAELLVAATRVRDGTRLEAHVTDAWALLGRLGDPPVWSVSLRWASIQAAILADDAEAIRPHGEALVRVAGRHPLAAVLAQGAGAWLAVLGGHVDPARIEAVARRLAAAGLPFEGSRLAGHAARHAVERKDMVKLLACARELHPEPAAETGPEEQPAATPAAPPDGLSPREREVARLVLAGKTYREIGQAMYISPRTAEHHIARIRRRLGADSRSDLLERLRVALAEEGDAG